MSKPGHAVELGDLSIPQKTDTFTSNCGGLFSSDGVPAQSLVESLNNNTARPNSRAGVHLSGCQGNPQTISAFMPSILPSSSSHYDTPTFSSQNGNINRMDVCQPLYYKKQANNHIRNREVKEHQGRHRATLPHCAPDLSHASIDLLLRGQVCGIFSMFIIF